MDEFIGASSGNSLFRQEIYLPQAGFPCAEILLPFIPSLPILMATRFPRSVYDKTGGLVYFARMVDKIRLHAAGDLGKDYIENLGGGFDGRCCLFLGVKYDDLKNQALLGGTDDVLFQWCTAHGRKPTADEIADWNDFMIKRGWRDAVSGRLAMRLKEAKLEHRAGEILTMFDFIEVDEGREPPKFA